MNQPKHWHLDLWFLLQKWGKGWSWRPQERKGSHITALSKFHSDTKWEVQPRMFSGVASNSPWLDSQCAPDTEEAMKLPLICKRSWHANGCISPSLVPSAAGMAWWKEQEEPGKLGTLQLDCWSLWESFTSLASILSPLKWGRSTRWGLCLSPSESVWFYDYLATSQDMWCSGGEVAKETSTIIRKQWELCWWAQAKSELTMACGWAVGLHEPQMSPCQPGLRFHLRAKTGPRRAPNSQPHPFLNLVMPQRALVSTVLSP